MSYLLDTNIVSELRKPRPDPGLVAWFNAVPAGQLYLSVLAVGEIRQGIERLSRRDPRQAAVFTPWLTALRQRFGDRVLDIDEEVAETWGRLSAVAPLPVVDGLMAATALVHDLTFVTRNQRDVRTTGVPVLDPFSATA